MLQKSASAACIYIQRKVDKLGSMRSSPCQKKAVAECNKDLESLLRAIQEDHVLSSYTNKLILKVIGSRTKIPGIPFCSLSSHNSKIEVSVQSKIYCCCMDFQGVVLLVDVFHVSKPQYEYLMQCRQILRRSVSFGNGVWSPSVTDSPV